MSQPTQPPGGWPGNGTPQNAGWGPQPGQNPGPSNPAGSPQPYPPAPPQGYPQGPYAQQQYGGRQQFGPQQQFGGRPPYPPQAPPPPKKHTGLIIGLVAAALFFVVLIGGCAALFGGFRLLPTRPAHAASSSATGTPQKVHKVIYKVTTNVPVTVTYGPISNPDTATVTQNWEMPQDVVWDVGSVQMEIQSKDHAQNAAVGCQIIVDGAVKASDTETGPAGGAECSVSLA